MTEEEIVIDYIVAVDPRLKDFASFFYKLYTKYIEAGEIPPNIDKIFDPIILKATKGDTNIGKIIAAYISIIYVDQHDEMSVERKIDQSLTNNFMRIALVKHILKYHKENANIKTSE